MFDLIKQAISGAPDRETKVHIAREFLQLFILKILFNRGYFKNLAFVGGTALRFLHGLRRFSEDLDFSLINKEGYKFDDFLKKITYDLEKGGFSLDVKKDGEPPVPSAMLKFKNLLFPLGLSSQRGEKLSIKLEVDSNPPEGWQTETSLVSKHFVFTVTHLDIPSLYALKLHACFFRKYTKGRDFYDLLWYLGRKELPNFKLLNNALEQTESRRGGINAENLNDFLKEKLAQIDFPKTQRDVARFIQDKNELQLIDKDVILKLILK